MTIEPPQPVFSVSDEIVQPSLSITNEQLFLIVEKTFNAIQSPDLYFICAEKLIKSCREIRLENGIHKTYVYNHIDRFYHIINTTHFLWTKIYAPCYSPIKSLDYKFNVPFLIWKFKDALYNDKSIKDDHLIAYSLNALYQLSKESISHMSELMRRTVETKKIQTINSKIENLSERKYLEKEFSSEKPKSDIIQLKGQLLNNNYLNRNEFKLLIQSDFNTSIDEKFNEVKNAAESNNLHAFIRWTIAQAFSLNQNKIFSIVLEALFKEEELSDYEILSYIDVLILV